LSSDTSVCSSDNIEHYIHRKRKLCEVKFEAQNLVPRFYKELIRLFLRLSSHRYQV